MFNQPCFVRWLFLILVFCTPLNTESHKRSETSSFKSVRGTSDIEELIRGNAHYKPVVWDPSHKINVVFNISGDSPLHIVLIREKKGHCEMFIMRFTYRSILKLNVSVGMTVCVAKLHNHALKEKCTWVNDSTDLRVKQGSLYGMPKDCGPWYLTVFTDVAGASNSNDTELSVEVSKPYDPLVFRWLRVITNLAFIPGITIAFRRGFYAECVVYVLNFLVSCVYHLCETDLHCFKGYDRLHYSDMFASDLSIIITVWTMTGIREPLKHIVFLAITIMLQFAVWETTNSRDHLYVNLFFGGLPACYLLYQYIFLSIKRRSCYPSRKRWVLYLAPGFTLAITGAILLELFISESDNYYYVHSIWHLTIMLSVAFLIPHKEDFENQMYLHEFDKPTSIPLEE